LFAHHAVPCTDDRTAPGSVIWKLRVSVIALTCIAGITGAPQLSMPVAEIGGLPVGLLLLGQPGADGLILAVALAAGH
jgi:amidase